MIKIIAPIYCNTNEFKYIVNIFFEQFRFFGYTIDYKNQEIISIISDSHEFNFSSVFFKSLYQNFKDEINIPSSSDINFFDTTLLNNYTFKNIKKSLPIFFGNPSHEILNNKKINFDFDIFGMSFFLLSRYEEFVQQKFDRHGRYPFSESILSNYELIKRPLVNEYFEFLRILINHNTTCNLQYFGEFEKIISCDVDWPLNPIFHSKKSLVIKFLSLFKNYNFKKLMTYSYVYIKKMLNINYNDDYFDNLKYLIKINKECENKLILNFLPVANNKNDPFLNLSSNVVINKFRELDFKDFDCGIHFSYLAKDNKTVFEKNLETYKNKIVLNPDTNSTSYSYCRFHFLRFNITDLDLLTSSGIVYDSSLYFAESYGFRSSFCRKYLMYDLKNREVSNIIQIPLVFMDKSFTSKNYNTNNISAIDLVEELDCIVKNIKFYQGTFCILWHNSEFDNYSDYRLYEKIIKL